jgi:hypothetical protein
VFIREPLQFKVILRSPERVGTTKNPERFRGIYFEFAEGMILNHFRMDTN